MQFNFVISTNQAAVALWQKLGFSIVGIHGLLNTMSVASILLVDDHEIFRRGMSLLLLEVNPGALISEADSVERALALDIPVPDVVLLDIHLRGISGIEGIALVKERWPQTKVIVLSGLCTPEATLEALARGASTFISKGDSADCIVDKITQTINSVKLSGDASQNGRTLTYRQHEVLGLLARGMANKLIARQLDLSENTVRRHVQDILGYFQVESRTEAVVAARRRGLVE